MSSFQGAVCCAAGLESALAPPSLSLDEPVDRGIPGECRNSPLPSITTLSQKSVPLYLPPKGTMLRCLRLAFPAPPGLVQALEKSGDYRVLSLAA